MVATGGEHVQVHGTRLGTPRLQFTVGPEHHRVRVVDVRIAVGAVHPGIEVHGAVGLVQGAGGAAQVAVQGPGGASLALGGAVGRQGQILLVPPDRVVVGDAAQHGERQAVGGELAAVVVQDVVVGLHAHPGGGLAHARGLVPQLAVGGEHRGAVLEGARGRPFQAHQARGDRGNPVVVPLQQGVLGGVLRGGGCHEVIPSRRRWRLPQRLTTRPARAARRSRPGTAYLLPTTHRLPAHCTTYPRTAPPTDARRTPSTGISAGEGGVSRGARGGS